MTTTIDGEQRVLLHNIRWCTYQLLMEDRSDSAGQRVSFDQGLLEITVPNEPHEELSEAVAALIQEVAVEMDIDYRALRSTTFRRADLERGFEPDLSYYVQNVDRVRGKERIDFRTDPAPKLVFEVDITHSSIDKLALFAEFGVRELWWQRGGQIGIFHLGDSGYARAERSLAFPVLTVEALHNFFENVGRIRRSERIAQVQAWLRQEGAA